jgi:hypothetical protein
LRTCWINTYLRPPDLITYNTRKNFVSNKFKQYASVIGVGTKEVPVKAYNSIGIVERYHGLIQRAYQIIVSEIPELDKDMALQMAFKAINDSAGPDSLVLMLLVFGAYPKMIKLNYLLQLPKELQQLRKLWLKSISYKPNVRLRMHLTHVTDQ